MNEEIFEFYPKEILTRIEERDRRRMNNRPPGFDAMSLELTFEDLKLWQPGTLTVSFKGGSPKLHKAIAEVASEWTKFANIQFNFGDNGSHRQWQPGDTSHIRVGFAYSGYWSLVGTDSHDTSIANPGDITLNLSGFDVQPPLGWKGTVLHEFGHALGFHHEHQSPAETCDFNWDLLYEELAKPPNGWSREKVDHNMKQLPAGGLTFGPHDRSSIMHYAFPAWMFVNGASSPCYTKRNVVLSEEDKRMAQDAYPADREIEFATIERRISSLKTLNEFVPIEEEAIKTHYEKHLNFLESRLNS